MLIYLSILDLRDLETGTSGTPPKKPRISRKRGRKSSAKLPKSNVLEILSKSYRLDFWIIWILDVFGLWTWLEIRTWFGSRSSSHLRLRARLKVNLPVDPMCFWHVMLGWSRLTEYLNRAYVKNGDTKQHKFEIIWNNDGYYRFNMKNNSFPERPNSLSMGSANDCAMVILMGEWMCTITNLQWAQTLAWFGVWKTSCLFKWTIFSGLLESLGWYLNFIQELAGTPKLLILAISGGSGNHEVLVARHTMGVTLW